jgi:HEAT repeat protein
MAPSRSAHHLVADRGDSIDVASLTASDEGDKGSTGAASADTTTIQPTIPWTTLLLALWGVGTLALLARLAVGLTTVQRIARRAHEVEDPDWRAAIDRAAVATGVRYPVAVRFSDEGPMPFTCGVVRPIVVLPNSAIEWGSVQRDAVLLHEMAHISRGDLPMNLLSHVMRALYWVNPLAWLAAHRLRVEGERACDDTVLRAGAKASDYADHLLSIIKSSTPLVPSVALAMARRSDFEGRLLAILEPGVPRARLGRIGTAALAGLFVGALVPLAAMTSAPQAVTPPDTRGTPAIAQVNNAPLPPASATVAALIGTLDDADAQVRLAAVNSLRQLEDPAAIAALSKVLKEDTDARVREAAAWALGEIGDTRAVPSLIEALKVEHGPKVREKIVEALGNLKDPSALSAVTAVLKDPTVDVRREAVQAISRFEDPSAAPALAGLIHDDDIDVRRRVADALGSLENPSSVDALMTMAKDADADVRSNAIDGLHHYRDLKLVPLFSEALKDPSADVRKNAAEGFNGMENLKTAPRALIDATADMNRDVRRAAAEALGNIGDEAAVPALKKMVGDGDADTRRTAVDALKDIGGPEAIQTLMGLLKDPDPAVRKAAVEALGKRHG